MPYASCASSQSCRTASITRNSLPSSTCQKVQPLQLGAPCTPAPTLWIDPGAWPSQSRLPSTPTTACQRRLVSVGTDPGALLPHDWESVWERKSLSVLVSLGGLRVI